jgi:cytosine/adenosine deaminase-related metal-dependent hydrolase
MLSLHARWVLPVASPPIDDGWVAVEQGRVLDVGSERRRTPRPDSGAEVDLGRAALLPGLVNCHTHLELSWLQGAVPATTGLTRWIRQLMALRREQPDPAAAAIIEPMRAAIEALRSSGVVAVGDISNTLVSVDELAKRDVPAAVFYELIRFRGEDADAAIADAQHRLAALPDRPGIRVHLAAHAPYSVSARLLKQVFDLVEPWPRGRTSIHLGESPEECEFLREGGGPWRGILEDVGAWDPQWVAPACEPVEYLDGLGVLDSRVLAVHAVHVPSDSLRVLASRGSTIVTCPRSNHHVGAGDPPVERFYESHARVAIGTDSLASAPDLSIWPELAAMRRLAPSIEAARFIESATRIGAEALGLGSEYGTIEPGKRADLVAVAVPPGVDDVEEYLVSGIEPDQVTLIQY